MRTQDHGGIDWRNRLTRYAICLALRLRLLVSLTAALLALHSVAPALANGGPGVIAGQVQNGTAGGDAAGVALLLRTYTGDTQVREQPQQTGHEGLFRFEGLEIGDHLSYALLAAHGGVSYGTELIKVTADAPERQLQLRVFEASATDPGIRTARSVFVVGGVDQARQELLVMEIVTLENPSDRTFVPRPGGGGGPMDLVRFGLPAGAHSLAPSGGLDPAEIVQVDRGFASFSPVIPGEQTLSYTYRIPYTSTHFAVEKSLTYGAAHFVLLAPETGPQVVNSVLEKGEAAQIGPILYRVWSVRNLPPGARLAFELQGLPAGSFLLMLARYQVYLPPVLLALALAGGAGWMTHGRLWGRTASPVSEATVDG
jgi:hypothetical protein